MTIVIANSEKPAKPFLSRIHLCVGDITQTPTDAIAMLVPQNLDFRGTLNNVISTASGVNLDEFILEHVYKPRVGDVYALPGFDLLCGHILLGIMPHFRTDFEREDHYLTGICRKITELGRCMLLKKMAFPFLGLEEGYPKARAARLMIKGISDRLDWDFEDIRIVCTNEDDRAIFAQKLDVIGWPGADVSKSC